MKRKITAPISIVAVGAISALSLIILYSKNKKNEKDRKDRKESHSDDNDNRLKQSPYQKRDKYDKNVDDWSEHIPSHMKREVLKEKRRRKKLAYLAMKSPMYDNVQMIDPNGVTLAKISKKKAKWYVEKGLAHYCESPDNENESKNDNGTSLSRNGSRGERKEEKKECIQLDFEPKDNSNNTIYHTADKQNICVKCGRGDYHLMRHHIVPSTYRSLLPKKFKSHMSHDITLLCGDCHMYCQQESQKRMNEIEDRCRPPGSARRYTNDEKLYKVRSSALALLNWKHKIPEEQLKRHYKCVTDYLINVKGIALKNVMVDSTNDDNSWITPALLQELIDLEYRIENPDFIPGPELVVNSIIDDEEKIAQFVRSWRRHFIDTVHPRFLPEGWSIDHHVSSNDKSK